MNTLEIASALRGVSAASVGVYAADRIPRILSLPVAIVTNMDTANKPGSHWVAFYISKNGTGNFFDSFGMPPTSPYHLDSLRRNCKNFRWNKKKMQSFKSKVCGEYCIMFLRHMCTGTSLYAFCSIFSENSQRNDYLVSKFYATLSKKLKHKNRYSSANSFPRENSTGNGVNQSCSIKMLFK